MRRRTLLNLALAAIAVALALVAWLEPGRERAPEAVPVSGVDPASIARLRIETPGADPIVLEREDGRWTMRAPRRLAADPWRVASLLGVLAARSTRGFRAAGNDLAPYGLDPPRARLVLDRGAIAFGDTDPLDGLRYVLADGQVHLVEDAHLHHLAGGAAGLAHSSPLGPDPEPVSIALRGTRLVRDDGAWRALGDGIGDEAARAIAEAWRRASAATVRRLDPHRPWRPGPRIQLRGADAPIALEIAGTDHSLVLGRRDLGLEYHFARASAERLLRAEHARGAGSGEPPPEHGGESRGDR